jgi:hypothetical protein
MRRIFFCIVLGLILTPFLSCKEKKTEVFWLKDLESRSNDERKIIRYYYVISNPPKDTVELVNLIMDYVNTFDMSKIDSGHCLIQKFYKESRLIDRNYKAGYGPWYKFYPIDDVSYDDSKYEEVRLASYHHPCFNLDDRFPADAFVNIFGKNGKLYFPNGLDGDTTKKWIKTLSTYRRKDFFVLAESPTKLKFTHENNCYFCNKNFHAFLKHLPGCPN